MGLCALWGRRVNVLPGLSVYHPSSWGNELFLYGVSLGFVCGKKDIYLSMIQVIIKSVPKGEIQREKSPQCWGLLH